MRVDVCAAALCAALTLKCFAEPAAPGSTTDSEEPRSTHFSGEPWNYYVSLGAQLLPSYDENGRSSGLNNEQFFAQINADGRFGLDDPKNRKAWILLGSWHLGANLTLAGTSVKREDKPSFSPDEFNDVAQTISTSLYAFAPFWQASSPFDDAKVPAHNVGLIGRVGALSRESLADNGDSVNWVVSLGVQYTYEDYRATSYNGTPGGYIRLNAARFEDYGGFGRRNRLVAEAALRVVPSLGLYVGFQGNMGSGPDEVAVVFTFVRQPSQLANLFSGLLGNSGAHQ